MPETSAPPSGAQTEGQKVSPSAPSAPVPAAPVAPPAAPAGSEAASQMPAPDSDEKFFAAVAYLGPLFLLTLIVKPKSAFCKFHSKQSMVLLLLVFIVFAVLFSVPMVGSLLTLAIFAVYVIAMYRAYRGDWWTIPMVGAFAGKMNIEAMYGKAGLAVSSMSGLKETAETLAKKAGDAAKALGGQEEEKKETTPTPEPPAASTSGK